VKYIGPLPKECGVLFGVEIIVSWSIVLATNQYM
jgi:hypothetical protein